MFLIYVNDLVELLNYSIRVKLFAVGVTLYI